MKFNILKNTRRGRLQKKISLELSKKVINLMDILNHVDEYEKDNLNTINHLKKEKIITTKRINGAIKQFLHAHPMLTKELIGSLSKRIVGAMLSNHPPKKDITMKLLLIGFSIGVILTILVNFFL